MRKRNQLLLLVSSFFIMFTFGESTLASPLINVDFNNGEGLTSSVELLILVAVLTLAPSFLILFTCFTHVIIVLGLTRQGLGTMTLPPNQVLVGLALFITIYIMSPVISEVNEVAYEPFNNEEITLQEAVVKAEKPIKEFMVKNTYEDDLKTFLKLRGDEKPENIDELSIWATVPAYTLSQITKGLFTGLMIYATFTFIDILVGSVLMFMGMMMLPPQIVSLPLKLAVFVFIGGFTQVIEIIFQSIVT